MAEKLRLGVKVRQLRRREGLTQQQLAERLEISTSYLNLIENNRRPLSAPLLIRLAKLFDLDLQAFAGADEKELSPDLMEAFGDPLFDAHSLQSNDVREFAGASPEIARAVLTLYRAYQSARHSVDSLAAEISDGEGMKLIEHSPSEEVSNFIQSHLNYFPDLEAGAEKLRRDAKLADVDLWEGLVRYLGDAHGIQVRIAKVGAMRGAVRRFDPQKRVLTLSELLRRGSRNFQLAHQVGLLEYSDTFNKTTADAILSADESRALCRVSLANYFAGAVLMPYDDFLEASRAERYDIELLSHRFRCSFEQVCHRLTSLRKKGAEGIPFHLVRVDLAGNISKRFSASGMRFPRFNAACPLWNVHAAFLTPNMISVQLERMPDGITYFSVARTLRKEGGGFHASHPVQAIAVGCETHYAREMVYSDGIDIDNHDAADPVGITCRLCERMDCEQRAFPPVQHPLRIEENVRGLSFYAPVEER